MRVVFVCTENSNRSQMAEGFARQLGLEAHSAGSKPSGTVNPTAIKAMSEKGIDIAHNASKSLDDLPNLDWDWAITMGCGDSCPFIAAKNREDWQLPDPKAMPYDEFCKVRDEIQARVQDLAKRASINL